MNHPTRPVMVTADIDIGIADTVERLNTLPGMRTFASCQGTIGEEGPKPYGPQILASWPESLNVMLLQEFEIELFSEGYGYLRPRA